ncbi:MAG TPA: DUF2971 domain-containing protein [Candidatus Saccharimonadales bacterium]|nr:DUF2971 domain-containing protein [Candidatus Saccharimonadales bacterium]
MIPIEQAKFLIETGIRNGEFPRYLYKYREFNENTESIFSENSLWFSKPTAFNDPFDCQIFDSSAYTQEDVETYLLKRAGVPPEMAKEIAKKFESTPEYFSRLLEEVKQRIIGSKGILSLSQHPDNILMWSHYSKAHSGFVLGFDILGDIPFFTAPLNIRYQKDYPAFQYLKEPDKIVSHGVITKSELWRYEGEIRIIKNESGKLKFARECLKEVIFGYRSTQADREKLFNFLKNMPTMVSP